MSRKFLTDIDLNKNQLLNAVLQVLSSDPSSPVVGQFYFNSTDQRLKQYTSGGWIEYGTGAGTGNVSKASNATAANILQLSGGTDKSIIDYAPGSAGLLKVSSAGVPSLATLGTDYAPATSGTSALKGNGSGGFSAATINDLGSQTADYSANSHKITNLTDPTSAQDAATKNYVDGLIQGVSWKNAVRAISTTNITLSGAQTIDGVSVIAGDRVLVAGQTTASANGIYVAASGSWTRSTDAATGANLLQATVLIEEGTTYADTAWTGTANAPITVGTTSLPFVQINGGTVPSATTTTPGKVQLATTTQAQAKSDNTTAVTPLGLATFTQKYATNVGDGSSTSIAITHNLGSRDVTVLVYDASTYAEVECDVVMTSTTVVTLSFNTAPASNAYRVVVTG